ncbi:PLP-dependent aminotransferase family protein [Nocardia huaxiensis]|uniref:aminotransferase-like domain-containing protein n=1 Tax=Nocardia huaxiensis TaxID=2755382 RepID=UPI001E2B1E99|nr:PLP-dependent aminotransferase family protein [Nocardia huaxiensis]UFS96837.1 PLP-dependent aminotransferase family protein [Nocardia huaxiensis]
MSTELALSDLHESVADPASSAMTFLNEVVERFPEAVSFAPGRPAEGEFRTADITRYLAAYVSYLSEVEGFSAQRIATELFQYGRTNGQIHPLIARTVANDEDIVVDPEAVVVTVGAQEGMLLVLRALFAGPADVLLVASPCYVGITGVARLLGIEMVPVPEGPEGVEPAVLLDVSNRVRATGKRPRALYLVSDFANPTGSSIPGARRRQLLDAAAAADLLVIEDNPYGFFRRAGESPLPLKALDADHRVIYLGSFAKTCIPGARVGYVLADQPVTDAHGRRTLLAQELSKIKSMVTVNTSTVSQAVIGGMLIDSGFRLREANTDAIKWYAQNLQLLLDELSDRFAGRTGVAWTRPDGGFFVVVDVPFRADDAALERSARDFGVLWTPMTYFHIDGGGTRQLRLSCSALAPDDIRAGVARLADFIESEELRTLL